MSEFSDQEMEQIQREVNPDFWMFLQFGMALARATGLEQNSCWGEHGPGCRCTPNTHFSVQVHANGRVGFGIHKDANFDEAWKFLVSTVGTTLTKDLVEQYSGHPGNQKAQVIDEPEWMKTLNLGVLTEE